MNSNRFTLENKNNFLVLTNNHAGHSKYKCTTQKRGQKQRLRTSSHDLLTAENREPITTNCQETSKKLSNNDNAGYDWFQHWYPIANICDLDAKKPTSIELLGLDLVIFLDASSLQWSVLENLCPHRLAPLSEGRITENGNLQCSYHGWEFDADGKCKNIPQADAGKMKNFCLNPKSCVKKYPSTVIQGLLWIFPIGGAEGFEMIKNIKPFVMGDLEINPNIIKRNKFYIRDLPYSHDVLIENLLDPAHVSFSHHGVLGNRYNSIPFSMSTKADSSNSHMKMEYGYWEKTENQVEQELIFHAPHTIITDSLITRKDGKKLRNGQLNYIIPLRPGWSRIIVCIFFEIKDPIFKTIFTLMPEAVIHTKSNAVLDGDMVLLNGQERTLAKNKRNWKRLYFTPTATDIAIIKYRNWQDGAGDPFTSLPQTEADLNREEKVFGEHLNQNKLLDRYKQHVENCKDCLSTLKILNLSLVSCGIALGMSSIFTLVSMFVSGKGFSFSKQSYFGIIISVCLAFIYSFLSKFRKEFFIVEYHHWKK